MILELAIIPANVDYYWPDDWSGVWHLNRPIQPTFQLLQGHPENHRQRHPMFPSWRSRSLEPRPRGLLFERQIRSLQLICKYSAEPRHFRSARLLTLL